MPDRVAIQRWCPICGHCPFGEDMICEHCEQRMHATSCETCDGSGFVSDDEWCPSCGGDGC